MAVAASDVPARDHRGASISTPWWETAAPRLLVADENPVRATPEELARAGLAVTFCSDGAEALWWAGRLAPAVVILSATLPGVPAIRVAAVLAEYRAEGETAVLGVSVGPGEAELAGAVLAAGATAVVARPYGLRDLELLVGRAGRERWDRRDAVLVLGALRLDGPAFTVEAAGRHLRLSLREFEVLRLLMLYPDRVVSLQEITALLCEERGDAVSPNTIAVYVRRLRAHLAGVADIITVRSVGYRLRVLDAADGGSTAARSLTGVTASGIAGESALEPRRSDD